MFRVSGSRKLQCRKCKRQIYELGTWKKCPCGGDMVDISDNCPNCGTELVRKEKSS